MSSLSNQALEIFISNSTRNYLVQPHSVPDTDRNTKNQIYNKQVNDRIKKTLVEIPCQNFLLREDHTLSAPLQNTLALVSKDTLRCLVKKMAFENGHFQMLTNTIASCLTEEEISYFKKTYNITLDLTGDSLTSLRAKELYQTVCTINFIRNNHINLSLCKDDKFLALYKEIKTPLLCTENNTGDLSKYEMEMITLLNSRATADKDRKIIIADILSKHIDNSLYGITKPGVLLNKIKSLSNSTNYKRWISQYTEIRIKDIHKYLPFERYEDLLKVAIEIKLNHTLSAIAADLFQKNDLKSLITLYALIKPKVSEALSKQRLKREKDQGDQKIFKVDKAPNFYLTLHSDLFLYILKITRNQELPKHLKHNIYDLSFEGIDFEIFNILVKYDLNLACEMLGHFKSNPHYNQMKEMIEYTENQETGEELKDFKDFDQFEIVNQFIQHKNYDEAIKSATKIRNNENKISCFKIILDAIVPDDAETLLEVISEMDDEDEILATIKDFAGF